MLQVSDVLAIESVVSLIISENPDQVLKLESNPKLLGWFVGQVMKQTGGKANPGKLNKLLQKKLAP